MGLIKSCYFSEMFGPGQKKNPLDMIHITATIIFIQSLFQLNVNLDLIILLVQLWLKIFQMISHVLCTVDPKIIKTGFFVRLWFFANEYLQVLYYNTLDYIQYVLLEFDLNLSEYKLIYSLSSLITVILLKYLAWKLQAF